MIEGLDKRMGEATEPDTDDQHRWELGVLTTLAASINDDQGFEPDRLKRLDGFKYLIRGNVRPAHFTHSGHREMYKAICALDDRGEGVDAALVEAELKNRNATVGDKVMQETFCGEHLETVAVLQGYINHLDRKHKARAIESLGRELQEAAQGEDSEAMLAKVQHLAFDLDRTSALVTEAPTVAEALPGLMADLQERNGDRKFVGLDTGFDHFNHVVNGLTQSLYVIAAPPSAGKTTFVKQLADNVAEKSAVPVLFFSYEQSAEELHIKTLGRLGRVNTRDIIKGRTDKKVERQFPPNGSEPLWSAVEGAAKKYQAFGRHMRIIEAGLEVTTDTIRIMAQAAMHRAKADRVLIVIDFLQIVPVANVKAFASAKDRVDFVCSELRRIARDLNSPVVVVSSMNRAGYTKATFDGFKESGGIEYGADVAAILKTEKDGTGSDVTRALTLHIIKNRNGELADIKFEYRPDISCFTEGNWSTRNYLDSFTEPPS